MFAGTTVFPMHFNVFVQDTGEIDECVMDGARLTSFAPRLAEADVFVCGPERFIKKVLAAAATVGVPKDRIHHELFVF